MIKQNVPTSFDILKTIAVVILVTDHFGYFFANNVEIFRVIGRLGYLLFIFCYGYNGKYHFDIRMISLTILMIMNSFIINPGAFKIENILNYSILISVIIAQVFMYFLAPKIKEENIFFWLVLLEILALPTRSIFAFGTEGLIICICGYVCATFSKKSNTHPILLAIGLTFYTIIESIDHGFSYFSMIMLAVIFMAVWASLARFENHAASFSSPIILFISKYSLLIFFVHYEIFAIIHNLYPSLHF